MYVCMYVRYAQAQGMAELDPGPGMYVCMYVCACVCVCVYVCMYVCMYVCKICASSGDG